jgi:hypothetical protein
MTQEENKSPLPSMVNYPEPIEQTVNAFGFDSKGIRYKISPDYHDENMESFDKSKESNDDKQT